MSFKRKELTLQPNLLDNCTAYQRALAHSSVVWQCITFFFQLGR